MEYREQLLNALLPQELQLKGLFASLSSKYETVSNLKNQIHAIVDWDDGKTPNIEKQFTQEDSFPHVDHKKAKELLAYYLKEFTPFGLPLCNTLIQYDAMVWKGPTKYPFPFLTILVSSIMVRYYPESFNFITKMKNDGVNNLTQRLKEANLFETVGKGHWEGIKGRYTEHIKYIGHILKMWPAEMNPQIKDKANQYFGVIVLEWWAEDRFIEEMLKNE